MHVNKQTSRSNNYIDPGKKTESSGILDLPTFEGEKKNKKIMLVPIHSRLPPPSWYLPVELTKNLPPTTPMSREVRSTPSLDESLVRTKKSVLYSVQ